MFSNLESAIVKNLGMENVNINLENDSFIVGAIAGKMAGSTIENCWVSGNIILNNNNDDGFKSFVGGLVGNSCYGYTKSVIKNCYNISSITVSDKAKSGRGGVGGLIAYDNSAEAYITSIQTSYNAGQIIAETDSISYVGGLLGYEGSVNYNPSFTYCYYLQGSADKAFGCINDDDNMVKLTESQMKNKSYLVGLDFDNVWEVDPYCTYLYPQLKGNRAVRVSTINLKTQPSKLVYYQGDKLDLSGATIDISYEDEITTTIPVTTDMVSGYDMNQIGVQTVTVAYGNRKASFDIEVKEIPVTSVSIPETLSIYRSKTYQMIAEILPVNASNKNVTWKSDDTSIVSVDNTGLLKAKAKGKTKIKVTTSNGLTKECEVTVLVASAQVTLNQTTATLKPGESVTLTAQIAPLESTDTIIWESNNTQVAEVIEGIVVAKNEGVAVISAYTESGVKATCTVSVKIDNSAEIKVVKGTKSKIKSISNVKGKKIKLKLSGRSSCTGYQIQYGTKSNFKSAKTKRTTSNSFTISGLKKGKKYYVRVRSYKVIEEDTYYGKWSSKKSIKVKK